MKYTFKRLVALTALIGTITTHCYGMNNDTQNERAAAAAAAPRTASSTTRTGSVEYTRIDEHTVRCTLIPAGGYTGHQYFNPSYDPSILGPNVRRLEVEVKGSTTLTLQNLWQGLFHILTPLEGDPNPLPSVQEIVFDFFESRETSTGDTPLLQAVGTLLPNLRLIGNKQSNCFALKSGPIFLRGFFPRLETLEVCGCNPATATIIESSYLEEWADANPGIGIILVRPINRATNLLIPQPMPPILATTVEEFFSSSPYATEELREITYATYDFHRHTYRNLRRSIPLKFVLGQSFWIANNPDGTFNFPPNFVTYKETEALRITLSQLVKSTYMPDLLIAFHAGRRVDLRSLSDSHRQGILDYLNENRAKLDAERRPIMEKDPWVCTLGTEGRILAQAYKWLHENSEDVANGSALSSSSPLVVLPAILSENTGLLQRMAGEHYRGFPVDLDGVQEVSFGQALSYLLSQR